MIISPANSSNYISNLFLPFSICLAFLINKVNEFPLAILNKKWFISATTVGVFAVCLVLNLIFKPGYLFLRFKDYDDKVDDYYSEKCIALTDSSVPLTQSMLQLINFGEVFVCDKTDSEKLIKYSEDNPSDKAVVYVSRFGSMSDIKSEEAIADLASNIGYSSEIELYSFESYSVYLLER